MYEQYWGLTASPFTNSTNSTWFHESPTHEEALARMFYLIEHQRRFGLLCGHSGIGKSLSLSILEQQMRRGQRQFAFVDLRGMDGHGLLWHLAASLGMNPDESATSWQLWRSLEDHVAASEMTQGHAVCIFDHVDLGDVDCLPILERIAHLTAGRTVALTLIAAARLNVTRETAWRLNELSDLQIEIEPFSPPETGDYIRSLLAQAGCRRNVFDLDAIDAIHERTLGIPRDINRLCDFSLLAGMVMNREQVDLDVVEAAVSEVPPGERQIASEQTTAAQTVVNESPVPW